MKKVRTLDAVAPEILLLVTAGDGAATSGAHDTQAEINRNLK